MTGLPPLHRMLYEPLLRRGLEEDLGRAGDVTTDAIVPADSMARAHILARAGGRIAGLPMAATTFSLLDPTVAIDFATADGCDVSAGHVLALVEGSARAVLTGERLALNLLGHLSGVATSTAAIALALEPFETKVVCTRKTTPGLRALEKYAVRAGGGANHRFGLDDAVLIKDNHLAVAGSVGEAVQRVRRAVGHMVKIELEADDLGQVAEAVEHGVDAVLLDNMDLPTTAEAVALVDGRAIVEASGTITSETAPAHAEAGVDLVSVGWITHSAPALDVALELG